MPIVCSYKDYDVMLPNWFKNVVGLNIADLSTLHMTSAKKGL